MAVVFKGFHTPVVGRTETLYDSELVRQDLMNHFNTKKGERAFDADYGFIAWDLLFELEGYNTINLLEADARRIISLDPRLNLKKLQISRIEYGYQMNIVLEYVVLDALEELTIVFDARSNNRMATYSVSSL
ncbi:GPW/gp25 family protein [Escherichia coli O157]|uniref:GPW/gp25 family protein n=1 Tax=Escherichia coli TaxID=562 RepID=UPI0019AF199E|nr:GPW/gp25 family protein [Escherichia coli]MED6536475.1 GPW/gp25 family protein [Escherichia coli O157]MDI0804518.1 GPW/gp25 family protein [Escherichia coli]MDI1143832.1 GPW/gp25 family protein [Escherichia coli]MED6562037.1 GPW/gp25 family protein [Escherichia coli O157]